MTTEDPAENNGARAKSFGAVAAAYDAARPTFPAEALTWINFALDVPGESEADVRVMAEALQVMTSSNIPTAVPADEKRRREGVHRVDVAREWRVWCRRRG